MKYTLRKYIDASEVFNRVSSSLKSYFDSDLVIIDEYYKVIDHCNATLGFKINPTKEAMLTIESGSAVLPDDFLLLDLALVVDTQKVIHHFPQIKTETLTGVCPTAEELSIVDNPCCSFKLKCGKKPTLVCELEDVSMEFCETYIIRLTERKYCASDCLNIYSDSKYYMEIRNGQIWTDCIDEGKLYILYTASLNNRDNIPQCLDNPIILEYYEQALKYRILSDLYINKRLEIAQALQLVEKDFIKAKNAAITLATTPEFSTLMSINNTLKRDFRKRYHYLY